MRKGSNGIVIDVIWLARLGMMILNIISIFSQCFLNRDVTPDCLIYFSFRVKYRGKVKIGLFFVEEVVE